MKFKDIPESIIPVFENFLIEEIASIKKKDKIEPKKEKRGIEFIFPVITPIVIPRDAPPEIPSV